MEHLRGRRWHANLDVVFRAQLQKPLEARRGVLRTLTFITVRKEQRDAGQPAPLGFPRTDELVDDHLRSVAEIAELAFPNRQATRLCGGVAVLETHHRLFGQYRIGYRERGLVGGHVLQRNIAPPRGLVVQHRMAVKERAPSAVLPGKTHQAALLKQAGVSETLRAAPVEREFAAHHALARPHDRQYPRMQSP